MDGPLARIWGFSLLGPTGKCLPWLDVDLEPFGSIVRYDLRLGDLESAESGLFHSLGE